jgi:hypothetical protein
MSRTIKLLLAIIIPVALIGAYFIVSSVQTKKEEAEKEAAVTQKIELFNFEEDTVSRVVLIRDGQSIEVVREDDSWSYAKDVPYDLKQNVINSIGKNAISLTAARMISEEPEDLSQFGLDPPVSKFEVHLNDGTVHTGLLGDRAPTGSSFYFKKADSDTVYTISLYHGNAFLQTEDDLRETVLAEVDLQQISYLKIATGDTVVEMEEITDEEKPVTFLSRYLLKQPYKNIRSIDSTGFQELSQNLPGTITASTFVDENPADLSLYGLDKPHTTIIIRDPQKGYTLYLGDTMNERQVYATLASHPRVFTISSYNLRFLPVDPFDLVSKFALIISIDVVDSVTVSSPANNLSYKMGIAREPIEGAEAEDEEENVTYYLNGEVVEEDPFKTLYQKVIGLMADSENPQPDYSGPPEGEPVLIVSYELNKKPFFAEISLYPFNKDFYALYREGVSEFLISKEQVVMLLQAAEDFPDIED